ncbi:hypothetical protein CSUI_009305 [Cystoisospora suis]|uniref:Uncharacterized protein n=1 Tax=Cystoisospora suis TaxID=483139 RepID=A0A2C6JI93_9APIC|nr:hypothetical protein CSUI_009305 [Cystoisospora suis]
MEACLSRSSPTGIEVASEERLCMTRVTHFSRSEQHTEMKEKDGTRTALAKLVSGSSGGFSNFFFLGQAVRFLGASIL